MADPQPTQPPTPRRRNPLHVVAGTVANGARRLDDLVTETYTVANVEGYHRSVYTLPLRVLDRVATAYETVFAGAGRRLVHFLGEHDYLQLAKNAGLTLGLGAAAWVGADIAVDYVTNANTGGLGSVVKFAETALPPLAAFAAAKGYLGHIRNKAWHAVQSIQGQLKSLSESYAKVVGKAERLEEQRPMQELITLMLVGQVQQQPQQMLPAPQGTPPVAQILARQQQQQQQQDADLERTLSELRGRMGNLQNALHHNILIVERTDGLMRLPWAAFGFAYGNFVSHHVPLIPDAAAYGLAGLYLLQREQRGAYTRAFVERGALWMVGAYAALPFVTGFASMILDKIPLVGETMGDFVSGWAGTYRAGIATAVGLWRGYKSLKHCQEVVHAEHQAYAAARHAARGGGGGGH